MTDRERVYNLVNKVCDYSIELMNKVEELKQESNELKQRVAELEKPKKKHKIRAMTNGEYCSKWLSKHKYCVRSDGTERCPLFPGKTCLKENVDKPLVINGKYILIEVKE